MTLSIHILDMRHVQDNYTFILRDEAAQRTAVVDPTEAAGIISFLEEKGWSLDEMLITHHHWDHVGGVPALKKKYNAKVVGNSLDAARIPLIDEKIEAGSRYDFAGNEAEIIDVSGHTIGHIAYYFKGAKALFCGDALFAMGCGRMFEGTAEMFYASLMRLAALPPETLVYPTHEYTVPNGRFAKSVEPDNVAITEHIEAARAALREGRPSIPSTIARERVTNPFLRARSAADFGALRARKDAF